MTRGVPLLEGHGPIAHPWNGGTLRFDAAERVIRSAGAEEAIDPDRFRFPLDGGVFGSYATCPGSRCIGAALDGNKLRPRPAGRAGSRSRRH